MSLPNNELGGDLAARTSYHVRRAREGDAASLNWVVERLSPLLLAQARYRLGKALRNLYDPEDLVNEVWTIAWQKLPSIEPRDERYTPVLVKYLSTVLFNRVRSLLERHVMGKPPVVRAGEEFDPVADLAAGGTGVTTQMWRGEMCRILIDGLEQLSDEDRELVILRGIEQHPYRDLVPVVGGEPKALAVRYQRALVKLRAKLPDSVLDELGSE